MARSVRRRSWLGKSALTHLDAMSGEGTCSRSTAVERSNVKHQRVVVGQKGSLRRKSGGEDEQRVRFKGQGKLDSAINRDILKRLF